MSSGLRLRLNKYLFDMDVPSNGVIANIYALDADQHKNSKRNVVIPVGNKDDFRRVELKPGRYLVEAILPSGDIISQEAETAEGNWPEVVLQAEHSAHEWHSWQNLLGNVRSSSGYEAFAEKGLMPDYDVLLIRKPPPEFQSGTPLAKSVWPVLAEIRSHRWFLPTALFLGRSKRLVPNERDEGTQLHSLLMNYDGDLTKNVPRWYAVVTSSRSARLLTIPCPWFSMNQQEVPTELMITKNADHSIGTSWAIQDRSLGTVLGYLANGALQVALDVANHNAALQMLFDKYQNPLGAAAGGYLLIGTMKASETPHWNGWINNLRRDFRWLPDGAIQYAWLKLKQAEVKRNRGEAREALFEAYDRGLPYYSLGLQWLLDGLTLLGEQDVEATNRLKAVQRVSWLADMSNLFTTLSIGR